MVLHLTKNLAEKLNLSPAAETVTDDFLSWRAHYVQEHGQRFVVFMNDASRFTVVLNQVKAAMLKKLPELFIEGLRNTLLATGVNPETADKYIEELGAITYSKNADRKKTAQLNKNIETVWWALEKYTSDLELSLHANNIIYNATGSDETLVPQNKIFELLGRYRLPGRKCQAFDLNVRLDLDGKDAIRKLRVPASITFEKLHRLLQLAFGWKNCHLYSFGLFKEWNGNYYPHPEIELVAGEDDFEANPDAKLMADVKLSEYVPEYRKILYIYDFGDDWHHFIEVERIIEDCEEDLPVLLSGEGDAPPEDVGGVDGFAEFLKVIADPADEDYEDSTEWAESQGWQPFNFESTARYVKSRL